MTTSVGTETGAARLRAGAALLPGLLLAAALAGVATAVGQGSTILGGPVAAVALGVVISVVRRPSQLLRPGISFTGKRVLQVAVVLLGAQLSLKEIAHVGVGSLPVMLVTLVTCLAAAWWIGRRMGVVGDLRTLIGVGTGICGASAIAAVTPVIGAAEADVAYAVSTIFVFNVAAILVFPLLGHALGLSQHAFGLFAGTAVNDTSSVVATATTYGATATQYAVVVKLVRTLMIIPICLGLAARRNENGSRVRVHKLIPLFLIGFLVLAAVNSAGLIPTGAHVPLKDAATFLISMALGAIGLSTDPAALRRAGARPLVLGGVLWVVVATASLVTQYVTGVV